MPTFGKNEFLPQQLVSHFNAKFGRKKNGNKFTRKDIDMYIYKRRIPRAYGGQRIKWMKTEHLSYIVLIERDEDEFWDDLWEDIN